MKQCFRLGNFKGIEFQAHISLPFVIVPFFLYERPTTLAQIFILLSIMAILFASALLHELGHSLAAHWCGIKTERIVLSVFGGVAQLDRVADRPVEELIISLAGPLVNLMLALVALAYLMTEVINALYGQMAHIPPVSTAACKCHELGLLNSPAFWPFGMNLILFFLNLIPAYPLDGGRILRAAMTMIARPQVTIWAIRVCGAVGASALFLFGQYSKDYVLMLSALMICFISCTTKAIPPHWLNRSQLAISQSPNPDAAPEVVISPRLGKRKLRVVAIGTLDVLMSLLLFIELAANWEILKIVTRLQPVEYFTSIAYPILLVLLHGLACLAFYVAGIGLMARRRWSRQLHQLACILTATSFVRLLFALPILLFLRKRDLEADLASRQVEREIAPYGYLQTGVTP